MEDEWKTFVCGAKSSLLKLFIHSIIKMFATAFSEPNTFIIKR